MSSTTQFPMSAKPCPSCGGESDCATGPDGATPEDGDISLCMYCGAVRAFMMNGHELLGYRVLTEDEIATLPADARLSVMRARSAYATFATRALEEYENDPPESLSQGVRILLEHARKIAPPSFTGKREEQVSLTDKVFAWRDLSPVLLRMPGSHLFYLPCFSSAEGLRGFFGQIGIGFDVIKKIEDGMEFMSSLDVHPHVTVILDPRITEEGRVRFIQIQPTVVS